jgi:hypothetical protein
MARGTNEDEQKTERFNMFMTPSESKAIDDWAWENKIRSKSDAVRRLVQIGLRFDRQFGALIKEVNEIVDGERESRDKILDAWARKQDEGGDFDAQMGATLLIAYLNLYANEDRLISILFGVLGETASLKGQDETAEAIQRTDAAADEYYSSVNEVLKPLIKQWKESSE